MTIRLSVAEVAMAVSAYIEKMTYSNKEIVVDLDSCSEVTVEVTDKKDK